MSADGAVVEPTAERPYIVETWTGRRVLPGEIFDSFDGARDRISQLANAEAAREGGTEAEQEATYNGVCEDLFAVRPDGIDDGS